MKKGIDYIGVGVGAIIINDERNILLAKRGKNVRNESGKWVFPGGGVEFGEKVEDTIIREIKEELGIDIQVVELLSINNNLIPEEKQHWLSPCFICKIVRGTPHILEPEKCDEIGWFTVEEASSLSLSLAAQFDLESLRQKLHKK